MKSEGFYVALMEVSVKSRGGKLDHIRRGDHKLFQEIFALFSDFIGQA